MDSKGQLGGITAMVTLALGGALIFVVFLQIWQPIADMQQTAVVNVANESAINTLWGLIPFILLAGFLLMLWLSWQQGQQYGGYGGTRY